MNLSGIQEARNEKINPTLEGGVTQITVRLAGVPVGKGRARFVRSTGHAFTPEKTRNYESALRVAAGEAMAGRMPIEGPVEVGVIAAFPVPASWSKTKKRDALVGIVRPTGRPDADNLLKALDAFNQIVFRDDGQIVKAIVSKCYSDVPCLEVIVRSLENLR